MAANVETMFSVREKPWHDLGTIVEDAPTSADAIRLAGLDWTVVQEPIYTNFSRPVEGYRENVRSSDGKVLGVVSGRYKVVQNVDAFSFTDEQEIGVAVLTFARIAASHSTTEAGCTVTSVLPQ